MYCFTIFLLFGLWILSSLYIFGPFYGFFSIIIGLFILSSFSFILLWKKKTNALIISFIGVSIVLIILLSPESREANEESYILNCQSNIKNIVYLLQEYNHVFGHFPPDDEFNSWRKHIQDSFGFMENSALKIYSCDYFSWLERKKISCNKPFSRYVRVSVPETITPSQKPNCFILMEAIDENPICFDTHPFSKEWVISQDSTHHTMKYQYFQPFDDMSKTVLFSDGSSYNLSAKNIERCISESKSYDDFKENVKKEFQNNKKQRYVENTFLLIFYFLGFFTLLYLYCFSIIQKS